MIALLVAANWRTGWSTVARSVTLYAALVAAFVLPHLAYVQWAAGVPTYFAISREYVRAEAGGGAYRAACPVRGRPRGTVAARRHADRQRALGTGR